MTRRVKNNYFLKKIKVLRMHNKELGIFNLIFYLLQRVIKSKNSIIKINVKSIAHPLYVRNVSSDIQIFTQIFLRHELNVKLNKEPKIIIDAGANIGMATVYLKNKFSNSKIFSVEPDQSNFEMLLHNTSKYDDVSCYKNGLWDKPAWLTIINQNAGNESFVVKETEENMPNAIKAITIDELVLQNKIQEIDLLKIDIEGSEAIVFGNNSKSWISITKNILVEVHNWINLDAEVNVQNTLKHDFSGEMAGEYHFFQRKII